MKKIVYLLIFICLFNLNTRGQFKNTILETNKSLVNPQPAVALNLKNKNNIVLVSAPDKVFTSHDAGENWTKSRLTSCSSPGLISDKKGDFYLFYQPDSKGDKSSTRRIVFQRSSDEGDSWSEAIAMSERSYDQGWQWAVADPNAGRIYATWTEMQKIQDGACQSKILFSENNAGKRWSDPVLINESSEDCMGDAVNFYAAMPAVGPDDQFYVAWAGEDKIFMDRSLNKGKNWLRNNFVVQDIPGGISLDIPGAGVGNQRPFLMSDNSESRYRGMLYMSWADQRYGKDDANIWFMRSANYGDNWTSPVKVNDDSSGKHQFLPAMAMDVTSGIIYIVFYDRRSYDDLQTDVYLAYSTDGGGSFTNKKISETAFTPDEQFNGHISVAAHGGRVVPVWTRVDEGETAVVTAVIKAGDLTGIEMKGEKRARRK